MRSRLVVGVLCVVVCVGCFVGGGVQRASAHQYGELQFDPRYWTSVTTIDQVHQQPAYVVTDLQTIPGPGLIYEDPEDPSSRVLMTMFTDYVKYDRTTYDPTAAHPKLWVSAAPDLWEFHQENDTAPDQMALRTKQLLGMPSFHPGDRVVELWVTQSTMFRPCRDPSLTRSDSSLDWPPGMGPDDPHRVWMESNATWSYDLDADHAPYPWTQMGYTYDWYDPDPNDPSSIRGLDEFIVQNNATIGIRAVVSLGSYKYYDRDTCNFDVTDDCDTIWAGLRYTPTGDTITVHSGAIVWQGITVSSAGYTVTNGGTILGPGRNIDNTFRDATLAFEAGGSLVNTGTIGGFRTGVLGATTTNQATTISNSGTISGSEYSVQTQGGSDSIVNTGLLDGKVDTGGGNDSLFTSGMIRGDVAMGEGDDEMTIQGGTIYGDINGGAGTNTLTFNVPSSTTATHYGNIDNFHSINLERGEISLNGQVAGDLTISPLVHLRGNLMLTGSLVNEGQFSPGNSISVIDISGSYTQASGSTLNVEISKPYAAVLLADRLQLTGSGDATLESGSTIHIDQIPGSRDAIRTDDRFIIITTSTGNVVDNGVTLTTDSAFLAFERDPMDTKSFAGNNKVFTLNPYHIASFASLAPTRNSRAVARGLDADGDMAQDEFAMLVNDLLFMTEDQFVTSIGQLGPDAYLAVSAAAARMAEYQAESLSDYLRMRRQELRGCCRCPANGCGTCAATAGCESPVAPDLDGEAILVRPQCTPDLRRGFAQPIGVFYGQEADTNRVGFQANSAGLLAGVDRFASDTVLVGLGLGYASTDLTFLERRGRGDTETLRIGPYLTSFDDSWFLDASATYGYHDNNIHRWIDVGSNVGAAGGEYHAHDASLYLGAGREWCSSDRVVSPIVSLQYVYYGQDGFTETGPTGDNLAVAHGDSNWLRSNVGLRAMRIVRREAMQIIPDVSIGWAHEFLGDDRLGARFAAGVDEFHISREGVIRDAGYFGVGLNFLPCDYRLVYFRYRGELSRGGNFHSCDAGFTWRF